MKSEIRMYHGRPTLWVDGKMEIPILFFGNTDIGTNVTEQAALAANAGIHLHSGIYNLHFTDTVPVQCPVIADQPAAKEAISDLCRCLDLIINGDAQAKILLRVKVGAYFKKTPPEWEDQRIVFADGRTIPEGGDMELVSTSSDHWADIVDQKLTEMVQFLIGSSKYRDHVIGIHLENCEWFEYGFRESGSDVSAVANAKFASWQKEKYGADYIPAEVPRDLPNNISFEFYEHTLLTEKSEQRFIDYFDFINELVAERIERFAKTIKDASDNRLLVLAFYGYYFELADCQSGHFRMQKLLNSPYLDGFAGPVSYSDRTSSAPHGAIGATSAYMTTMDSIARHGKLWFQESDQRTTVNGSAKEGWLPGTDSIEAIGQIHKREVGDILLHGCGMWAMDLCGTGWLKDNRIWHTLAGWKDIYASYLEQASETGHFDVIFVVDEAAESIVGQPSFNGISGSLLSSFRFSAYRAGISFAFAEISDVASGLFPDGKLYIFLNPYRLHSDTAKKLREQLADKYAVWMYGFGMTAPDDVSALTGMEIQLCAPGTTQLIPNAYAADMGFAVPSLYQNVTHRYASANGTPLGTYADGTAGAFAQNGRNIFWGGTSLSSENIRALARLCGVHVYTTEEDAFFTDGKFAVYAAMEAGTKTVILPDGTSLTCECSMGETVYWDLCSKQIIS